MTIEATAGDIAQDGSVTIKVDGKSVKYVKEADLGAVKSASAGFEKDVSDLQAKLATANTKYDTEHQETIKERAAKETAVKTSGESATLKTKVEELTTEVAGLKESSGKAITDLTERVRKSLVEQYKIEPDKVKDMALEDLVKTEENLILIGAKPAPADYDGKGGDGGSSPDALAGKSPLALATMGYEEKKK